MRDIYERHFGLRERPFSLVPDPDFLYLSDVHRQAVTAIDYGIVSRSPITLITGELGSGKTLLLRNLMTKLRRDVTLVLISNASGGPEEVLRWVMSAIDRPATKGESHIELITRFQKFLISEYAANRRVLLAVDEAQHLERQTLETLRLMTNINADKHELIQLLLIGQPELRQRVFSPDMLQFAQRISAGCHLGAMSPKDTAGYVRHRLAVAGARAEIFSEAALTRVHELSRGIPRLINQLCDMALVYAFSEDITTVDLALVERLYEEDACFFLAHRRARGEAGLASVA